MQHLQHSRHLLPELRRWDELGPVWPDLRAGLGWHWGWGTTQLHGAAGVGIKVLDGDPRRVRVHGRGGTGSGSLLLFQPADPRWNRRGTTGLSVVIEGLPTGTPLTWAATLALGRRRIRRRAATGLMSGGSSWPACRPQESCCAICFG